MGKFLGHPSFSASVKWGWHFPTQPTLRDKGPCVNPNVPHKSCCQNDSSAWNSTSQVWKKFIPIVYFLLPVFQGGSFGLELLWYLGQCHIREGKYGADSVSSAFGIYQVWLEFFQCKCYSLKCGLHKDTNRWVGLTCFLWKTLGSLLRTVPYFPQCPQRWMQCLGKKTAQVSSWVNEWVGSHSFSYRRVPWRPGKCHRNHVRLGCLPM